MSVETMTVEFANGITVTFLVSQNGGDFYVRPQLRGYHKQLVVQTYPTAEEIADHFSCDLIFRQAAGIKGSYDKNGRPYMERPGNWTAESH